MTKHEEEDELIKFVGKKQSQIELLYILVPPDTLSKTQKILPYWKLRGLKINMVQN